MFVSKAEARPSKSFREPLEFFPRRSTLYSPLQRHIVGRRPFHPDNRHVQIVRIPGEILPQRECHGEGVDLIFSHRLPENIEVEQI